MHDLPSGSDVPWHRVYTFKRGDEVIWDRRERKFDIRPILRGQAYLPAIFKVATYNVLSDVYLKKVTDLSKRKDGILKYIELSDADIICLQEVTDVRTAACWRLDVAAAGIARTRQAGDPT